jgi:hypothetical protein
MKVPSRPEGYMAMLAGAAAVTHYNFDAAAVATGFE